ncbi:hypothetical protein FQN54_001817 [Arachnomyces sp. PD_36]|nr:hypothetical protein FQN54_001817 [Arachnomyces sp. PD_36]
MDHLPSKLPFSKKRLPVRVILSYIFDYLILIVLLAAFYFLDRVEPFHQPFSQQNYSLQYPYADPERISIGLCFILACVFPAAVIVIYTLAIDGLFSHHKPTNPATGRRKLTGKYRWKDRLWELNCGILGLLLSEGAAFVITGALKNACGKPRPDIIDRCKPNESPVFGLSNYTMCTQEDHHILKDGFRSFPSGHSSSSFAGLFYLSLYLCGKMHVLDNRGEVWKTFLILCPTLGASLIATSRIMDARHHPFDVITGSLLGILVAWASYRQYFPPLTEPWRKGRAYPIRSWGTDPVAPSNNPGFTRINESTEPIRSTDDEERRGRAPSTAAGAGVFRHPSSTYPIRGRSMSPIDNPFTATSNPYTRRVNVRDGNWSSSSSEDGDDGQGGYAMQNTYGRPGAGTAPMGEGALPTTNIGGPAYDNVDTAYQPQAPVPLQLNRKSYPRGDGGSSSMGSPPPPLSTAQQPQAVQQDQSSYSPIEGYERTETVTHPMRAA